MNSYLSKDRPLPHLCYWNCWQCHTARFGSPSTLVGEGENGVWGFCCFLFVCLVCLVSWRPRQLLGYIADGPQDRASDNFTCCHTWAGRQWLLSQPVTLLTPTQPVGSGRPQPQSNSGPPYQESRALPTELSHPHPRPLPPGFKGWVRILGVRISLLTDSFQNFNAMHYRYNTIQSSQRQLLKN